MTQEDFNKVAETLFKECDPHAWENRPGGVLIRLFMAFPGIDRQATYDHLDRVLDSYVWSAGKKESIEEAFGPVYLVGHEENGRVLLWCGGDVWQPGIENALSYDSPEEAKDSGGPVPGPHQWSDYHGKNIYLITIEYPTWMKCKHAIE